MLFHAWCLRGEKWIRWSNKEIAVYTILLGMFHRVLLADEVKPFLFFSLSSLFAGFIGRTPDLLHNDGIT